MKDKLRFKLRNVILKLDEMTKVIDSMEKNLAAKQLEYREILGAQKGLADVFLEEGMTLQQAWNDNYNNLRTEDTDDD